MRPPARVGLWALPYRSPPHKQQIVLTCLNIGRDGIIVKCRSRGGHPPGPNAEELRTILRCGLRVPDHSRAEPWRIQVLDKPAQQALGDFSAELFQREHPEANDVLVEVERQRLRRWAIGGSG